MHPQPIVLYTHIGLTPNPIKVQIILEELGVPYSLAPVEFTNLKREPYTNVNPNGRLPAIEDPNTGLTIWESGAIIDYLMDEYDRESMIHSPAGVSKWEEHCWKYFQVSGQGPSYGQRSWFKNFHPELLPSAVSRYGAEIERILSVIDTHLCKSKRQYLIGDNLSFVDLMFVPWNHGLNNLMDEKFVKEWEVNMPSSYAWWKKLEQRESVKKVYAEIAKLVAEQERRA